MSASRWDASSKGERTPYCPYIEERILVVVPLVVLAIVSIHHHINTPPIMSLLNYDMDRYILPNFPLDRTVVAVGQCDDGLPLLLANLAFGGKNEEIVETTYTTNVLDVERLLTPPIYGPYMRPAKLTRSERRELTEDQRKEIDHGRTLRQKASKIVFLAFRKYSHARLFIGMQDSGEGGEVSVPAVPKKPSRSDHSVGTKRPIASRAIAAFHCAVGSV
jgi:hypothetical protein